MRCVLSIVGLSLSLACCVNLAPDYVQPAAPVPTTWSPTVTSTIQPTAKSAGEASAVAADQIDWRTFFVDSRLKDVITLALENNRDLRVTVLNIEKARALYRIQDAARYPEIGLSAGSSVSRTTAELSNNGRAGVSREYSVELGMSAYELDFFGRLKNLSSEAFETYLSDVETRRSAHISLVAETAHAWLTLAADRERLHLATETLKSQQASFALTERSHDIGTVSGLDLTTAQASVETAAVDVGSYTSQVAQDINALNLLVGTTVPEKLLPDSMPDTASALLPPPAEMPSTLLLRRPDVLAAEHTLLAANADIGAARAAFFPSISLTAAGGTASRSLGGLFNAGTGVWSFLPSINLPIFNAGSNRANLDAALVTRDINVASYEKTIQTAFREVADALAERDTLDQRMQAQQRLTDANAKSYRLSEARYRQGIDSYLNSLLSQRSLYSAQQSLISLRLVEQNNRVTLYKVMGGGWSVPETVDATQKNTPLSVN